MLGLNLGMVACRLHESLDESEFPFYLDITSMLQCLIMLFRSSSFLDNPY